MVISDRETNLPAYNTRLAARTTDQVDDLVRLQDVTSTILNIAARADELPIGATTEQVLEQLEQAVRMLRSKIAGRGHTIQTSARDRRSFGNR